MRQITSLKIDSNMLRMIQHNSTATINYETYYSMEALCLYFYSYI